MRTMHPYAVPFFFRIDLDVRVFVIPQEFNNDIAMKFRGT